MLNVLGRVFKDRVASPGWQARIREMVPSYGVKLNDDPQRAYQELAATSETLRLTPPKPAVAAAAPKDIPGADAGAVEGRVRQNPDLAP